MNPQTQRIRRQPLLGQERTHTFTLPKDEPLMEERIVLRTPGSTPVALTDLEVGLTRRVTDREGQVLAEVKGGRYQMAVELPPWSARVGYFHSKAKETGAASGPPRMDAADPALAANEPARRANLD